MNSASIPTSISPGRIDPRYMSPTDTPITSAITISTSEGGMICASDPEAQITPEAMRMS